MGISYCEFIIFIYYIYVGAYEIGERETDVFWNEEVKGTFSMLSH